MRYEVAKLAQKLKLTKEQIANPKIISLLEAHLEDAKKILATPAPLELPKKPGAVQGGRYAPVMEALGRSRKEQKNGK